MKKNKKLPPEATFGQEAVDSFTEFFEEVAAGKPVTIRTVKLNLRPQPYDETDVKRVRKMLNVSQPLFAALLGVSPATIRSWEQGHKKPANIARRFMGEIEHSPEYWRQRLRESITEKDRAHA